MIDFASETDIWKEIDKLPQEDAYRLFVARFERRLFGLCIAKTNRRQVAEEIVQDVLLEVHLDWDDLLTKEPKHRTQSVLARARNKCIDIYRKQSKRPQEFGLFASESGVSVDSVPPKETVQLQQNEKWNRIQQEQFQHLMRSLYSLNDYRHRESIRLSYWHNMTYLGIRQEIANALGEDIGSVSDDTRINQVHYWLQKGREFVLQELVRRQSEEVAVESFAEIQTLSAHKHCGIVADVNGDSITFLDIGFNALDENATFEAFEAWLIHNCRFLSNPPNHSTEFSK